MTYDEAVEFADSTKKYGSILGLESIRCRNLEMYRSSCTSSM